MNEPLTWLLALVAGMVIGAMFFGGLWWTVRTAIAAREPALWLFGSLLVRTAIALAGLFYVSGGHWQRWLACLAGFGMARPVVMAWTRSTPAPEVGHGPQR